MAAVSFPDIHTTGTIFHFVQPYSGGIYFLGTAEITPQVQMRRYVQNVMNDEAGKTLPIQKTFDGEAATVATTFTRFSKSAYNLLKTDALQPVAGQETRWSRGGLVYGQKTFELWLIYDQFFNPAGTTAGLEIGYYFPQVELLNHDTPSAGTQVEKKLLVFDCTPYRIPQASHTAVDASKNERGFMLYSQDNANTTYFPADVRVPQ